MRNSVLSGRGDTWAPADSLALFAYFSLILYITAQYTRAVAADNGITSTRLLAFLSLSCVSSGTPVHSDLAPTDVKGSTAHPPPSSHSFSETERDPLACSINLRNYATRALSVCR